MPGSNDGNKGRGSKPRVQGKSSPTKTQRRIDRTVSGFPSIQAEGPEPPRKANRPRPMATRMPLRSGEGKPSSTQRRMNSFDGPDRPRNVSSRQATLNKSSGDGQKGRGGKPQLTYRSVKKYSTGQTKLERFLPDDYERIRPKSNKFTEVPKRQGRGSQAGSPSKKGRTVAGQTNPMKGRGGTSGKPKGN